jgi:hypothetical protein
VKCPHDTSYDEICQKCARELAVEVLADGEPNGNLVADAFLHLQMLAKAYLEMDELYDQSEIELGEWT